LKGFLFIQKLKGKRSVPDPKTNIIVSLIMLEWANSTANSPTYFSKASFSNENSIQRVLRGSLNPRITLWSLSSHHLKFYTNF
jgi:hypothetical protein